MLDALALRAEHAGLDASAPPQQADIDGWLIRLSPGKAKRSRCINALRAGTLPLDDLLARCQQAYDAASRGFEAGKFGFLEVLDAQRSLLQARSRYLNTLAAAYQAAAVIDRTVGR